MSKLRRDFLNFRPDAEDFGTEHMTVVDNAIHDSEGWKPVYLSTTTNFSTTGGLAASNATVLSIISKPVGSQGDLFCAWLANQTTPTLHVGLNGLTGTTSSTGYPLSFSTAYVDSTTTPVAIYAFDVCELNDKIFFTVEARMGESVPSTTQTARFSGYMNF